MRPEVFEDPVMIAGILTYIYKHPKEGQRYISVRNYRAKYKVNNRGINTKRSCYRYSKEGDLIKVYNKVGDAARDFNKRGSTISNWLKNGKSPNGDIWSKKPIIKSKAWEYSNKNFAA